MQQGNNLSPTLFNIFINDLTNCLKDEDSPTVNNTTGTEIPCLLYADDLAVLSTTKAGLQNKLNKLHKYCKDWGLTVNKNKTKIIVFARAAPKVPTVFRYGNDLIETVDTYKYLGVMFNNTGSFTSAQDHLGRQASKAAHTRKRSLYKQNLYTKTIMQLFDSLVVPVATYASEVWFPFTLKANSIDSDLSHLFDYCMKGQMPHECIQLKFAKSILGIHKKSNEYSGPS